MAKSSFKTVSVSAVGAGATPAQVAAADLGRNEWKRVLVRNAGGTLLFVGDDANALSQQTPTDCYELGPGESDVFVIAPGQSILLVAAGGGRASVAISDALPIKEGV